MSICKPCQRGADLISEAKDGWAEASGGTRFGALSIATFEHRQCKGCDCQHDVERQAAGKSVVR